MFATKQSKSRYLVIAIVILFIVIALWAANIDKDVVASVNGVEISKNELYNLLVEQNGQQALEMLITKEIINQEVAKQNIQITEVDVEKELEKISEDYGGKEAFKQAMEMSGFSTADLEEDIAMNLKVKRLLEPQISIDEEEMKNYFEENKEMFQVEEQVSANHILLDTEKQAQEVQEKLSSGEDFAELALKYSNDITTKEYGGSLGFIKRGEMVEEFEQTAFSLEVGKISNPVKTEYGYHIVKVEDKIEAKNANYEESKGEIKDILFEEKMQTEYFTWLDERYNEYKIENSLTA